MQGRSRFWGGLDKEGNRLTSFTCVQKTDQFSI